jgi:hypothetical protein
MNTTFYFENKAQAERFCKELRQSFILATCHNNVAEIYNFAMIKDEYKSSVLGIAKKIYRNVYSDLSAREKLQQMTMQDCIDLWNERATDMYHQLSFIKPMDDENWWNHLAKELGAWDLMHFVWHSGEDFNDSDMYFGYIEDGCEFFSFSTKQELIERIGEEFFIDNLTNE